MSSVLFRDVSFRHSSAAVILDGASFDLPLGWTGVVGPNGAGKTTLLSLVAGLHRPDRGEVHLPTAVPATLCRQSVEDLPDEVVDFGADWSAPAARWRSRLHLDVDRLAGWSSLSPGERKRWQLAAALASEPDVLLLDEPTNHLDAAGREVVVAALRRFRGVGAVVSHDRTLLDGLTTSTLRLVPPAVELRAGSWSSASQQWQAEADHATAVDRAARRETKRLAAVRDDVRRQRDHLEASSVSIRRRAGANRPDAREAGRKVAAAKAEAAVARRVAQLGARVDRQAAAIDQGRTKDKGGEVGLRHEASGRRWLAELRSDEVWAGDRLVLRSVDLAIGRGERVHLAGPNGSGKTTLLRALVGASLGVGMLPQELTDEDAIQHLADLRALDPDQRGRVLGTVALLGVDPERLLITPHPSPGEARKLALARLLVESHDLIVLDEPTNHLDLPSIERLQQALTDWPGALLLVTHDDHLAAATTDIRWEVEDGRVVET